MFKETNLGSLIGESWITNRPVETEPSPWRMLRGSADGKKVELETKNGKKSWISVDSAVASPVLYRIYTDAFALLCLCEGTARAIHVSCPAMFWSLSMLIAHFEGFP